MKKLILIIGMIGFTPNAFAHGDAAPSGVGLGKGIESYDEHEGFVLSKEAVKNFELQFKKVFNGTRCELKGADEVQALSDKKIYRLRDKKIMSTSVHCENFKQGDEVAIHGASFLRVVEMDLSEGESEEEEGHHD